MTDETVVPVPLVPPGTSVTAAVYLDLVKQYLYTGSHPIRDKLAVGLDPVATVVTSVYKNPAFQDNIRITIGLEDMFVWLGGDPSTVERGQFGTVASSHLAGSIVEISPYFSNAEILREINNELVALPPSIFAVAAVDITTSAMFTRGYDLPINPDDILYIRARTPGTFKDWPIVNNWSIDRSASVTDFPSGRSLFFNDAIPANTIVRVEYKTGFGTLANLTADVVATTGLPPSALDVPVLGAAIRLTSGREIKRNFEEQQGDTRRAGEVPPGANTNAASGLRFLYTKRVREEQNKLYTRYPARKNRVWELR